MNIISISNENTMSVVKGLQYTCATCLQYFSTSDSLIRHVFSHVLNVNTPLHICHYCGQVFLNVHKFCEHNSQDSNDTMFKEPSLFKLACSFCKDTFFSWCSLKKHVFCHISAVSAPLYYCRYCSEVFEDLSKLHPHMYTRGTSQRRSKVEPQQKELVLHFRITSTLIVGTHVSSTSVSNENSGGSIPIASQPQYACTVCIQYFSTRDLLIRHVFSHDLSVNSPLHICQYCGVVFLKGSKLCDHNIQNNKEIIFQESSLLELSCAFCVDTFFSWCSLTKHVFSHISTILAPLYVCRYCSEVYKDLANLLPYKYSSATSQKRAYYDRHCHSHVHDQQCSATQLVEKTIRQEQDTSNCCSNRNEYKQSNANVHSCKQSSVSEKCEKIFTWFHCRKKHETIHSERTSFCFEVLCSGVLKKHQITFSDRHTIYCKICVNFLDYIFGLTKRKMYIGKCPFSCDVFGNSITRSDHLRGHQKIYLGNRSKSCEICGKFCRSSWQHTRHQRIHFNDRPFCCDICNKSFLNSSALKKHRRTHSPKSLSFPFTCEICGKSFSSRYDLKIHRRIHSGERPFFCKVCGKTFMRSSHLTLHYRVHSGERPFSCEVCGKSFKRSEHVKGHKKIHLGKNPFYCEICGNTFTEACSFKQHLMIHSDVLPLSCKVCGKSFTQTRNLKTHLKVHSGERPFSCEICGKYFFYSGNLKTHLRVHSDERPFSCEICGKSYKHSANKKNHEKKHSDELSIHY